jgi:predicted negative regulator of RcsB-dependent stress response
MLKPKKKITKKEIKKDPFLEALYNLRLKFGEKQKLITRLIVGFAAVIIVVLVINQRVSNANKNAEALFGQALVSYEIGDFDNALFQFEQLSNEYAGTKTGKLGYYYLGKMHFDRSDREAAQQQLLKFTGSSSNDLLLVPAYTMLGALAIKDQNLDQAEKYFRQALKYCNIPIEKFRAKLRLADLLIDNDKVSEAEQLIKNILNAENVPFKIKQDAEEISGRISS